MNERIVIDPKVCHGKPVVRGTRMPVALIVGSLAGGMSFEDVQREYGLTLEDIRAALKFAGELVDQEQYHRRIFYSSREGSSTSWKTQIFPLLEGRKVIGRDSAPLARPA